MPPGRKPEPIATAAAIAAIVEETHVKEYRPILQALDVRLAATREGQKKERYRVLVSDGTHFLRCIAAEALAPLCSETGQLKKGCLIQLKQWRVTRIQTRAVIVLLDVEVVAGPLAKIGAPVNYAAPEEIKKEQLKQSSSQGYQDLAEDVVLGIARAMGAMRPGGPSQAGAGPTAQREITSKSYQMDIARDVAALDAALDAGIARPRDADCAARAANVRDAAAAGAPAGTSVKARNVLRRTVARHLAGCRDDADPDQNDGPLPLAAFAALDALRHTATSVDDVSEASAKDAEALARLARRVHHHDFLLRPSALGLLASVAARQEARHAKVKEAARNGKPPSPSDRALFDELRRCAQCVLSRLLAWPERAARSRAVIEASAKKTAEDDAGGALAFYDAIACGEALRALSLLGRLGVVGATADQTDSAPLVALLGDRSAVAEGLAATDDPVAAAKAPAKATVGRAVAACLRAACEGEAWEPRRPGDDDERQLWLDDVAAHDGPRLLLELLLSREDANGVEDCGCDDAFEILSALARVPRHQGAVVERIVRRVGGGVFSAHAAGMALYQMVDGSTHKKGELAILTALEAIRERARTCRNGADFSKRKGIKPIKNGEELKKASAEADAAMAELLAEEDREKASKASKKKKKKKPPSLDEKPPVVVEPTPEVSDGEDESDDDVDLLAFAGGRAAQQVRQQREKKKAAEVKEEPKPIVEEKKPRASKAERRRQAKLEREKSEQRKREKEERLARERAAAEQRRRSAEGRARAQAEKVAAPPPKAVAPPPVQAWGGAAAQKPEPTFSLNDDVPPPRAPASPPAPARLLDLSASRPLQPAAAARAADDVDELLRAAMDVTLDDSDPRVPTRRAAAPIGPPGVGAIGRAPGRRAPVDEPPPSSGGWGFGAAGPQLGAVGLPWAGLAGVRAENPAVANPSPFGGF